VLSTGKLAIFIIVMFRGKANYTKLLMSSVQREKHCGNGPKLWAEMFYNIGQRGGIGDPFIYWQTPVLGNKFSFETNISCVCNAVAS
jgi:hypothetical protein